MTVYIACNCHLAQIHFISLIYDAEKVTNPIDSTYCSSYIEPSIFCFQTENILHTEYVDNQYMCVPTITGMRKCIHCMHLHQKITSPTNTKFKYTDNKNIFFFTVISLRLSNWPSRKLVYVSASYKLPGEGWILFLPLNIYFYMIKEGTRTSMRRCYSSVKRPIYRATSFKGSSQ